MTNKRLEMTNKRLDAPIQALDASSHDAIMAANGLDLASQAPEAGTQGLAAGNQAPEACTQGLGTDNQASEAAANRSDVLDHGSGVGIDVLDALTKRLDADPHGCGDTAKAPHPRPLSPEYRGEGRIEIQSCRELCRCQRVPSYVVPSVVCRAVGRMSCRRSYVVPSVGDSHSRFLLNCGSADVRNLNV